MVRRDPEEIHSIPVDMFRHQVREWEWYREPIQTDFDGHLPEAGDAEKAFVGTVLDELTCVGTEGCIAANKPEKGVRIE